MEHISMHSSSLTCFKYNCKININKWNKTLYSQYLDSKKYNNDTVLHKNDLLNLSSLE